MTVGEAANTAVGEADASGADEQPSAVSDRLALVAILAVAAALRLYRLGADSLWDNEILSLLRATAPISEVHDLLRAGTHPPLYSQGVLRPWLSAGDSEFMQRLPSAVFGVATVAITYVLGRRELGRAVGLLGATMLAISPLHVYYSREGRMYALLALLVTLWIASLLRANRDNSWRAWSLYAVVGAAILYTHYYAGLTVAAVLLTTGVLYMTGPAQAGRSKRWFVSSAVIGLLFLPWAPTFVYQFRESSSNLPGRPIRRLPDVITQLFSGFVDVSTLVQILVLTALATMATMFVLATRRAAGTGSSETFALIVMAGAVLGTVLLAVVISGAKPILYVRYFVGVLPTLCILLGIAAVRSRPRIPGIAAYGLLMVVSIACVVPVVTDSWRPDFAAVGDTIAERGSESAVVLIVGPDQNDLGLAGFDHYNDGDVPVRMIDSREGSDAVTTAIDDLDVVPERVWLLRYRATDGSDVPPGFAVTFDEYYDSRFFERTFPMRLTLLESVD